MLKQRITKKEFDIAKSAGVLEVMTLGKYYDMFVSGTTVYLRCDGECEKQEFENLSYALKGCLAVTDQLHLIEKMREREDAIYKPHGFKNRREYLKDLAENNGVELAIVVAIADMLGREEDFDGLVTEVEDFSKV